MNRPRPAFTLIELLVVIAITAVLAAIIVPVVGTFHRRADLISCSSNLRQVGIAVQLYMNDNSGILPGPLWSGQSPRYPVGGNEQLVNLIDDYIPIDIETGPNGYTWAKLMLCPAYVTEIGLDNTDLRTFEQNAAEVEMIDGTMKKPFGYPGSQSLGRLPSSPAIYTQILEPENVWIIKDLDKQGTSGYRASPLAPDVPVHGNVRNKLYLDGHVEAEPVDG